MSNNDQEKSATDLVQIAHDASAKAPYITFDLVPALGVYNGMPELTLCTRRLMPGAYRADGTSEGCSKDVLVTAHLRTSLAGLHALKFAIAKIEEMLEQTAQASAMGPSASDLLQ